MKCQSLFYGKIISKCCLQAFNLVIRISLYHLALGFALFWECYGACCNILFDALKVCNIQKKIFLGSWSVDQKSSFSGRRDELLHSRGLGLLNWNWYLFRGAIMPNFAFLLKELYNKMKEYASLGSNFFFFNLTLVLLILDTPCLCKQCRSRSVSQLESLLTLVLLNSDIPCLCKQCRSRSVGF